MTDSIAEFYDGLAESYHLIYRDWRRDGVPRQGRVLDALIRSEIGESALTVLDCSCGIGTQAIGLALCGYSLRGTDISHGAIERARREAASFGVQIELAVADMRALEGQIDGSFDVVLTCDNSLPHLLTENDLRRAARSMHAVLRPGGLLVAGVRDYDALLEEMPRATTPGVIDAEQGRRIVFQVWDWHDDGRTYTLHMFLLREADGSWQTDHFQTQYRALRRAELTVILADAGFSALRWHGPEETGHHQPLLTARRKSAVQRQGNPR